MNRTRKKLQLKRQKIVLKILLIVQKNDLVKDRMICQVRQLYQDMVKEHRNTTSADPNLAVLYKLIGFNGSMKKLPGVRT